MYEDEGEEEQAYESADTDEAAEWLRVGGDSEGVLEGALDDDVDEAE